MTLKSFFNPQNLFDVNVAYTNPQERLFFLIGVILILLSVVLKISAVLAPSPVDQKSRNKFYVLFLSIGLAMIIWYFFRDENVMFFGSVFVASLIVLTGVFWFIAIIVSLFKHYGKEKAIWEKEQVRLRYLSRVK